jgi:hypothetical protein
VTVEVRKPIVEQYTDDQVRKAKARKKQRDTASLNDSSARRALELRSAKKSIAVIDSPNVVRGGATSRTREGNIFEANDHARMRSNVMLSGEPRPRAQRLMKRRSVQTRSRFRRVRSN